MNSQDIQNEFYKAVDSPNRWQRLGHLLKKIKFEKASTLYNAFIEVFVDTSRWKSRYYDQESAGGMLWKLKPKCKLNLEGSIRKVLVNYDLSIEELPWYYTEVYDLVTVRSTVKSIQKDDLNETERISIDTFEYWLSANPEVMKENLKNKWRRIRG